MLKPYIVVIRDNLVESVTPSTPEGCNQDFQARVQSNISNWSEYTPEDIDTITENGYEKFGNGSVCLTWIEV
jgi:hypothetical protein